MDIEGIPHKYLRIEAYYYVVIDTLNDMPSNLKQTANKSDGRT